MELVETLSRITLTAGGHFEWDPGTATVSYDARRMNLADGPALLLHELAHAVLGHQDVRDDNRYEIERAAWDLARQIAHGRGILVREQLIATSLRSVRAQGY